MSRRTLVLLMATAVENLKMIDDVSSRNFGILVDVGHLKVTARTLNFSAVEFLNALEGHIGAFHLSDNDGRVDNHRPFDKGAWFIPHLLKYRGVPLIIESHNLSPETLQNCISLLERQITE